MTQLAHTYFCLQGLRCILLSHLDQSFLAKRFTNNINVNKINGIVKRILLDMSQRATAYIYTAVDCEQDKH